MGLMNRPSAIQLALLFCRSPGRAPEAFQSEVVEPLMMLRHYDSRHRFSLYYSHQHSARLGLVAADPLNAPRLRPAALMSPLSPAALLVWDSPASPARAPPIPGR